MAKTRQLAGGLGGHTGGHHGILGPDSQGQHALEPQDSCIEALYRAASGRLHEVAQPDPQGSDERRGERDRHTIGQEGLKGDRVPALGREVRDDDIGGGPDQRGVAAQIGAQRQRPPECLPARLARPER